jgi:hypothetical protein
MDMDTRGQLETKAGLPPDTLVTHDDMLRAFEEFTPLHKRRSS